ncbi:MAG: hypothetical protein KDB90_08090 [Planctomycetes bacterium]|nr:hypothetical protein [Planctomycetota bacterium]
MRNTWKLLPLAVLAVMLFGCGGGGGTATPDDVARAAVKAVKSESFDDLFNMQPLHLQDSGYAEARREYRIKEGYDRWKDEKPFILGDKEKGIEAKDAQDPEEKSGIKDEDTWKAASQARLFALKQGCYKLYNIKKFEDRVTNAEFYMVRSTIMTPKDGESERRMAVVRFANIYGDRIEVTCLEDQGLWYMVDIDLSFPEELPKPPEDK